MSLSVSMSLLGAIRGLCGFDLERIAGVHARWLALLHDARSRFDAMDVECARESVSSWQPGRIRSWRASQLRASGNDAASLACARAAAPRFGVLWEVESEHAVSAAANG